MVKKTQKKKVTKKKVTKKATKKVEENPEPTTDEKIEKESKLSLKMLKFVLAYVESGNATQAAIKAGYSEKSAGELGHRLLKNVEVCNEIDRVKQDLINSTKVTQETILGDLYLMAKADIRDAFDVDGNFYPVHKLPFDLALLTKSVVVRETKRFELDEVFSVETSVKEVKFIDRIRPLELLGKYHKMWTDKKEITTDESFLEVMLRAEERLRKAREEGK